MTLLMLVPLTIALIAFATWDLWRDAKIEKIEKQIADMEHDLLVMKKNIEWQEKELAKEVGQVKKALETGRAMW